jgi:DNA-binding transcriptional regulator GbsR (MarR family)
MKYKIVERTFGDASTKYYPLQKDIFYWRERTKFVFKESTMNEITVCYDILEEAEEYIDAEKEVEEVARKRKEDRRVVRSRTVYREY